MRITHPALLFTLCSLSAVTLRADQGSTPSVKPAKDPQPEHISVSHTEGKGLGYSKGYSSLDLFLSQPFCYKHYVPFLDLRGHIFNDGKYAANAGLGLRWLNRRCSLIWGGNAFYDYLQTSHFHYNQVSVGLEALGKNWDARLNGYLPVGRKNTNIYRLSYDNLSPGGFLVEAREQLAMKGFDSEVGYDFCKTRFLQVRVGAGPYYYWGSSAATENAFRSTTKHAFGGRLSA
ncbi:MAG: inverse autotransporter beta domain-containing protein, partial [Chlamydiota bacterium]